MKAINNYNQSNKSGNNTLNVYERVPNDRKVIPPYLYNSGKEDQQIKACNKEIKIFIVHGHDDVLKYELKNFLQNSLGLPEPIILSEKPKQGHTIIESFEKYSNGVGLVFVLLTPDDFTEEATTRARQNVIFELGYFMGKLGRKSGRIILLHKGNIEIPSDLSGIMYLDVSNGIRSVAQDIREAIDAIE